MLTSIPPALLHRVRDGAQRVRDAAQRVHDLASLGLALLCPCEDDHGAGARWLNGEDPLPLTEEEVAARCGATPCEDDVPACTRCPWDAWWAARRDGAA